MDSNTPIETGRQSVLTATRTLAPADEFESGVEQAVIYLRPGTRLLRGFLDVETAWDTTTAAATIGDTNSGDADGLLISTDLKVAALTPLAAFTSANGLFETPQAITATVTATGVAEDSVGAATLVVEFIEVDRTTELYPYRG